MGKEARASRLRQPPPIVLPKGDYYELRAKVRDIEAIELDMFKAAQRFREQIDAARKTFNDRLVAISTEHGFDPAGTYRWDDATCALIPQGATKT
jgi:hypothetical protein